MFLRLLSGIIFFFLFTSCDFFSFEKLSDRKLTQTLDDVLIDYSTIDVYPMFKDCERIEDKVKQEQCFGNAIVSKLEELIQLEDLPSPIPVFDTVFVDLLIEKDNKVKIARIYSPKDIKDKIPNLDSILEESINKLPALTQPAIKRGIPVVSQFKLPVLIREKK